MELVLQTERLLLRPLGPDDLQSTHAYAGDRAHTDYMIYLPHDSVEETAEFLRNAAAEWQKETPAFFEFAILRDGEHIGTVSLYLFEDVVPAGELGWILRHDMRGKGYAYEAAAALRDFAVSDLKLKKLTAHCDARNAASARIMEKLGMRLESDSGTRVNKVSGESGKELVYTLEI